MKPFIHSYISYTDILLHCKAYIGEPHSIIQIMLLSRTHVWTCAVLYSNCSVWCSNYCVLYAVKCYNIMLQFSYPSTLDVLPKEIQLTKILVYCYVLLILLILLHIYSLCCMFGLHITCIMLKNVHESISRYEIYWVKNDGKLCNFCGTES